MTDIAKETLNFGEQYRKLASRFVASLEEFWHCTALLLEILALGHLILTEIDSAFRPCVSFEFIL